MSSADIWKYWDSVLGHEDCLAVDGLTTEKRQRPKLFNR